MYQYQAGGLTVNIINVDGTEYAIGAPLARFLGRETFNLYRSLIDTYNIPLYRCTETYTEELRKQGFIPRSTHSVTLIPFDELCFHGIVRFNGLDILYTEAKKELQ